MKKQVLQDIENNRLLDARRKIDEILLLNDPAGTSIHYIVARAVAYMKESYMENINLPRVARQIGVTPNYLSKLFVEEMGVTFSTYLNFLRVKQAEILLLNTDLAVTAIAEQVGYADTAYFIRVFRRYTRLTPLQFRYTFCVYVV